MIGYFLTKYGVNLATDYRQKYSEHSEAAAAAGNLKKERVSPYAKHFLMF